MTVFENASIVVGTAEGPAVLTEPEVQTLRQASRRCLGFLERGHHSVRLRHHCGIASTGRRTLEVLPKISSGANDACDARRELLAMLRLADCLTVPSGRDAGQAIGTAPLLQVFIAAFFDEVAEVIRGGLQRRYEGVEDDLTTVRGRIDLQGQFARLANRQDRLACKYDELGANHPWNRLLKAGLLATKALVAGAPLQRRWTELMAAFADVDAPGPSWRVQVPSRDRQGLRYKRAGDWAVRILQLQIPNLQEGDAAAPGLLFPMPKLFEAAVGRRLQGLAADKGVRVERQVADRALAVLQDSGLPTVQIRPDLVVYRDERVVALADTKWKRAEVDGSGYLSPSPGDVYQMHAYAGAFGCRQLALIYPWHAGVEGARRTRLELRGQSMQPAVLDVECVRLDEAGMPSDASLGQLLDRLAA